MRYFSHLTVGNRKSSRSSIAQDAGVVNVGLACSFLAHLIAMLSNPALPLYSALDGAVENSRV